MKVPGGGGRFRSGRARGGRARGGLARDGRAIPWGMLPLAVLVAVVGALPSVVALVDSFFHDVYGERSFAGLGNYGYLLGDAAFAMSGGVTILWALSSTAISVVSGYQLAVLLFESKRGFRLLYAVLLVPWGVPAFIAVPVWRMLLHGAGGDSLVRMLFGIEVNLLTDPGASFAAALFVDAWLNVPVVVFVIHGALRSIPGNVLDAARLDGAGLGTLSRRIYLPQVSGTIVAVTALGAVKAFKEFNVPFLLTAGGPPLLRGITGRTVVGATTTLEVYLYDLFRASEDYGIPAAYAAVLALFVVALVAAGGRAIGHYGKRGEIGGVSGAGEGRRRRARGGQGGGDGEFRFPVLPDGLLLLCRRALAAAVAVSSALAVYAVLWTSLSALPSNHIDAPLPRFFTLDNFRLIFTEDGLGRAFLNSLVVAGTTGLLISFLVMPAALSMRRLSSGRRAGVFAVMQAVSAAGGMHSLIPLYVLFRGLGLLDSWIPVVVVYLFHAAPFSLFTTSAFLGNLPAELSEAAELEGASSRQRLFRIVLPLALPAAVTSGMIAFLAAWNGFLVPLLFLNDDSLYTIGVRLHVYTGSIASGSPQWNRFAAASLVNLALVGGLFARFRAPLSTTPLAEHEA